MQPELTDKAACFSLLMEEVEETFGRRISSSGDCIHLSEEIYFRTSFRINQNTLRRFFGLVKAEYPSSVSTLNILSRYCGFDSFDELLVNRKRSTNSESIAEPGDILDYLISIFRNTSVRNGSDETFLSLVRHTLQFLQKHPGLADKFQRGVARTKNGQDYYFEQMVNLDGLNSFYGEGIRYYLNEKKTTEAQVFGNALLCLKSWLSNNPVCLRKQFAEVSRYRFSRSFPPLVAGWYYAAHLYFAEMNGLDMERILIDAQLAHSGTQPGHYPQFPLFEFIFSTALLLTQHYQEALYYIQHALKALPVKHGLMEQGYYKTLLLRKAFCLMQLGKKEEAEKVFNSLRPSQFSFLSKRTDTILYLILSRYLHFSNNAEEEQLVKLIAGTGYERLNNLKEG